MHLLFLCFWLDWVFVAARGLSLVAMHRLLILVIVCGTQALGVRASVVVAQRLPCSVFCEIEPMFPALARGLLSTVLPRKSYIFLNHSFVWIYAQE